MKYQVDDLTIDVGQRQISRGGDVLDIGGLTFDLFLAIVEAAPNIISSDELVEKVWSGRPTSPETITQRAMMLRQALGDDADNPRYVEVVRGHGFKLIPVPSNIDPAASAKQGKKKIGVIAGVIAIGLAAFFIGDYTNNEPPPEPAVRDAPQRPTRSVAVLPFENLSPNPDDAYFAAGLHSEILNNLGRVSRLRVIARTSVLQYAGASVPINEIANDLNVDAVMEGSVRYADDQVRVTAQLNDGETGQKIWSDTFTRDLENVFEIESEIAISIAGALEAELLPREREFISRRPTTSPQAYAQFLRAVVIWERAEFGIRDEAPEIERYLNRAVELDPTFARAYAYKARLYALATLSKGDSTGQEVFANAELALEYDESLGMAHVARGEYYALIWQGVNAKGSFERALSLSPRDPIVLVAYARFLTKIGEHPYAIELTHRLLDIAPNTEDSVGLAARVYRMAGQYDIAASFATRQLEIDASQPGAWLNRAGIEVARGNLEEALEYLRNAEELTPDDGGSLNFAYTARLAGDIESAIRHAGEPEIEYGLGTGVPYWLALGHYDAAMEDLSIRIQDRRPQSNPYWLVKHNAWNDPVLNQPEWVELREKMGYPDLQ